MRRISSISRELFFQKVRQKYSAVRTFFNEHPRFMFVAVAVSYMLVIAYYMTPQFAGLTTTVYGFGDNTAGAVWRYDVSPGSPFWGFETATNYPFGENISSPVHVSGSVQYVSYWLLSLLFGPILGYNLLNILGFLLSALLMHGFVRAILGSRWIAWLAGYAVAFTPYYQMKVGGHPTYGYQAIFIGILWLFFRLVKYGKIRDALLLGVLFATAFYFDIYLALFSTVVVLSLTLSWALLNRKTLHGFVIRGAKRSGAVWLQAKRLLLAAATAAILVAPLVLFFATQHNQINAEVAAARGNVLAEAKACSNWPHEYLTPFVLNPIFETLAGKDRYHHAVNALRDNFTCGIGEDSIGLSVTLFVITALGLVVLTWERINRRALGFARLTAFNPRMLVLSISLIGLLGVAIAFPPLKFHNLIPTPSFELLSLTTTWRTLARAYMLVNLALVMSAVLVLAYFAQQFKGRKWLLVLGYVVILGGVFVEYQAFAPLQGNTLSNFNYKKDVPSAYVWLASQDKINVVAEYPLEREGGESDAGSYYLTMQTTHKKKLFNSALSNSPEDRYRTGLKNLADPQTLPALRAFGVDAVIAHGANISHLSKLAGVRLLYSAPQSKFNLLSHTGTVKNDYIAILDIRGVDRADYFVSLNEGFVRNTNIIRSVVAWQYEAVEGSRFDVWQFRDGKPIKNTVPRKICFSVKMSVPEEVDELSTYADGRSVSRERVDGDYRSIQVQATSSVSLHTNSRHNMRVTDIGCSQ